MHFVGSYYTKKTNTQSIIESNIPFLYSHIWSDAEFCIVILIYTDHVHYVGI